jgi:hypothetical protein
MRRASGQARPPSDLVDLIDLIDLVDLVDLVDLIDLTDRGRAAQGRSRPRSAASGPR